jgi:hypothetical protein
MSRETIRERAGIGEEQTQQPEPRGVANTARPIRAIRHTPREFQFRAAGLKACNAAAATHADRSQLLQSHYVAIKVMHDIGFDGVPPKHIHGGLPKHVRGAVLRLRRG